MSNKQLAQLWTAISIFLLYYSFNTWLVTQGGNAIFNAALVVQGRAPAAIFGLLVCAITMMSAALVGRTYARRSAGKWHARVPVVGFDTIDTGSLEGKLYQGFMLFLLTLLPLASFVHFWRVLTSATIVLHDDKTVLDMWDWGRLTRLDNPAKICSDFDPGRPSDVCAGDSTFFPGLGPSILLIFTILAISALLIQYLAIFRIRLPDRDR